MIDLWFTDEKTKATYNCGTCVKNPATMKDRRCQSPGFDNLRKPRGVDAESLKYSFCPGKATWYPDIVNLYNECRIAMETGILPKAGSLEEQDAIFCDVFPIFLERWKEKTYVRVWKDVRQYSESILDAIFGKKKGR